MSGAMKVAEGLEPEAVAENGPDGSSEETASGGVAKSIRVDWLGAARQGVRRAGRTADGKTDRSLDPWARRARCEAGSRSCTWSNLEPLKES
jgi:hypothetical protein